ncbi:hypothetical protein D3C80_1517040 [compost metagenome]
MISAPSEMRCRPMPVSSMPMKVSARTKGIEMLTTRPARTPSERNETASTIAIASASTFRKPLTACLTTVD